MLTPDLMAHLIDIEGVRDIEFVDDRIILYFPVRVMYANGQLDDAATLVRAVESTLRRQTELYSDSTQEAGLHKDPFRRAQLTTHQAQSRVISNTGRRIRTRATKWQRAGQILGGTAMALAAAYWVTTVASTLLP
ncbi:hypothetical protein G7068_06610 [Leucobacter viscericola]|uniref:Uncharacterized protein n=1 Tax=Leucobacter viscericola TaxID=2714935 RepID=A0A6G7XEL0_9MICO|nr:hypothetical protein [Leucobacter viscericola]QIK62906.1 hypothetical protein G7068_06610 [Leucobacter viscericola]